MNAQKKIKWFDSIKSRLILTLICIVLFILCFSLGLNMVFLENYYEDSRIDKLINIYENVKNDKYDNLDKICSNNNVTIYKITVSDDQNSLILDYPVNINQEYYQNIESTIKEYYINKKEDIIEIKRNTDEYLICKMFDAMYESDYLDLFSRDGNKIIYIRINLESINDVVETANTLLLYISFLAIFEGIILMTLVSSKFTKPILNLANIANNMANLDFEQRYNGRKDDEVGLLGTSMNKMADKLQESIKSLENANKQLTLDIKEREKIDEMRKSFISDVSHELKTPLALIQGYAEGLSYSASDEKRRNFYCSTIMEETQKMDQLVKKLTSLTQIEYGYTKANLTQFDLKDTIDSKLQAMGIMFEDNQISLKTNIYNQKVEMDEALLDEVLNNYISNAIHHIDGERKLIVSFEDYGENVKVSIYNTGNHIPENEIDNLWIKFYKVDKARTRAYGGSGIGLSIVKAIMDAVNQKYGCQNKDGGVEFWFTLKKC